MKQQTRNQESIEINHRSYKPLLSSINKSIRQSKSQNVLLLQNTSYFYNYISPMLHSTFFDSYNNNHNGLTPSSLNTNVCTDSRPFPFSILQQQSVSNVNFTICNKNINSNIKNILKLGQQFIQFDPTIINIYDQEEEELCDTPINQCLVVYYGDYIGGENKWFNNQHSNITTKIQHIIMQFNKTYKEKSQYSNTDMRYQIYLYNHQSSLQTDPPRYPHIYTVIYNIYQVTINNNQNIINNNNNNNIILKIISKQPPKYNNFYLKNYNTQQSYSNNNNNIGWVQCARLLDGTLKIMSVLKLFNKQHKQPCAVNINIQVTDKYNKYNNSDNIKQSSSMMQLSIYNIKSNNSNSNNNNIHYIECNNIQQLIIHNYCSIKQLQYINKIYLSQQQLLLQRNSYSCALSQNSNNNNNGQQYIYYIQQPNYIQISQQQQQLLALPQILFLLKILQYLHRQLSVCLLSYKYGYINIIANTNTNTNTYTYTYTNSSINSKRVAIFTDFTAVSPYNKQNSDCEIAYDIVSCIKYITKNINKKSITIQQNSKQLNNIHIDMLNKLIQLTNIADQQKIPTMFQSIIQNIQKKLQQQQQQKQQQQQHSKIKQIPTTTQIKNNIL